MKKAYIQPHTTLNHLGTTLLLAASGGQSAGGWTPDELPDDYDEIDFGEGSKIPD